MKKVGFIFPGQGSQSVGMGKDFYTNSELAKSLIKQASNKIDVDFEKLMFEENDEINKTQFTQPAILLVSMIAFEIFKSKIDIKPEFVLGHSLGEISAICAAGGIDFLDAIELTHKRGEFMSEACDGIGAGMMALLGMEDDAVEALCAQEREKGKKVWAANYNSDGQVVLAGSKSDLESLVDTFKEAGAKRAIVLPMSVASHCPILESAIAKLVPYLEKMNDTFEVPVISNVTTKPYNTKDEAVSLLSSQLIMPVLYKQSIQETMDKVDMFIEFGNGNVLKGLNKKGVSVPTYNVSDIKTLEEVLEVLND